jgi:hypothetical protein
VGLKTKAKKATQFLSPLSLDRLRLQPHPWAGDGRDYYITNVIRNQDGHGGYTRQYAFDSAGLPYTESTEGPVYNPLAVARYALRMLAVSAATGDSSAEDKAKGVLPGLVASGRSTGAWGSGPAPDAMVTDRPSCMIQGIGISAILRLTRGRPEGGAAEVIRKATRRLLDPVEDNGTASRLNGGMFLEEFPRIPPSHVLNGCIYGLFALYDLVDTCGPREEIAPVVSEVEKTLADSIGRFTTGLGWSRYALNVFGTSPLASLHYHQFHIALLRVVLARTQDERLAQAVQRWERAHSSFVVRAVTGVAKTAQSIWLRDIRRLPLVEG